MREAHDQCGYTLHRITNQVVEPNATGVNARSYVDALVLGPDNQTGARSAGFYDDELVMTVDGWKIARRRFTMVLLAVGARGPARRARAVAAEASRLHPEGVINEPPRC